MNLRSLLPFGDKRGDLFQTDLYPFTSLQREMDRLFDDFTRSWQTAGPKDFLPRTDVVERDDHIEITAELPGLEEKDVEVTLVDNILTVRGEKKVETKDENENRKLIERSYGSFTRSIELPDGIKPEDIKATMSKGVLTVTLPKPAKVEPEAKKIEVKTAA